MYDRLLRFSPKHMDMCKNNPKKAEKITRLFVALSIIWIIVYIFVIIDICTKLNCTESVSNINIGTALATSVLLVMFSIPIMFFISVIEELKYGIKYFSNKSASTDTKDTA